MADEAVDFLREFHPGGNWILTCIDRKSKGIAARTFSDAEQMSAWIDRWNGKRNIYFTVNPTLGPLTKKASRKDIKEVEYLHVGIDPRAGEDLVEEQARFKALVTTDLPSGIPSPAQDAKLYNVDRIMRVPGTWNLPDVRKIAKGRTKVKAKAETSEPGREYELSAFPKLGANTVSSNRIVPFAAATVAT